MNYNSESNNDILVSELLDNDSVNSMGYGLLPKYPMLDRDLLPGAKAIYAYLCSLVNNKATAFPGRKTILHHLQISKSSYYKYLDCLIDNGYIKTRQEKIEGKYSKNIFTILAKPKKFLEDKDAPKLASVRGLKSSGYGSVPRMVMFDTDIKIVSKALYAYYCVFSAGGDDVHPKEKDIIYHLKVNRDTYYKYRKELLQAGYILSVQIHDGRLNVPDIILCEFPERLDECRGKIIDVQHPKKQDTVRTAKNQDLESFQCPKIQDTIKQDTEIQDTKTWDTIITRSTITRSTSTNQSIDQNSVDGSIEQNAVENNLTKPIQLNFRMLDSQVSNRIEKEQQLPFEYKEDKAKMESAIRYMAEYDSIDGTNLEKETYSTCVSALIELCTMDGLRTLRNSKVSYADIIKQINEHLRKEGTIRYVLESAVEDYLNAVKTVEIKNYWAYIQSCIWSALLTYSAKVNSFAVKMPQNTPH